MDSDGRFRDYPFVVVRLACHSCPRLGRYRFATLAERFGAHASLADVLQAHSAGCPASSATLIPDPPAAPTTLTCPRDGHRTSRATCNLSASG